MNKLRLHPVQLDLPAAGTFSESGDGLTPPLLMFLTEKNYFSD